MTILFIAWLLAPVAVVLVCFFVACCREMFR